MLYDTESGKRIKQPFNHVTWVHSLLRLNDFNLQQCLFGEHLLSERPNDPVALVESEKSAIIASWYLPQYVWLATGGKHGCFNETALRCLCGRQVTLFPDLGATVHWRGKMELMKRLGIDVSLFDFMELNASVDEQTEGLDIADYLLKIEPDEAILQSMIRRNPFLGKLIEDLDMHLVSVERMPQQTRLSSQPDSLTRRTTGTNPLSQ